MERLNNTAGSLGLKAELWQSTHIVYNSDHYGSLGLKAELWQSLKVGIGANASGSLGLKAELWQSLNIAAVTSWRVRLV